MLDLSILGHKKGPLCEHGWLFSDRNLHKPLLYTNLWSMVYIWHTTQSPLSMLNHNQVTIPGQVSGAKFHYSFLYGNQCAAYQPFRCKTTTTEIMWNIIINHIVSEAVSSAEEDYEECGA